MALLNGAAGFAIGLLEQGFLRHGGDFALYVDAIQQRAVNFAAIARDLIRCTAAFAVEVAEIASGA